MRLSLYSQLIKNGEDHELVYDNGADNGRIFDVRTGGMLSLPADFNGIIRMIALRQGGCMVYVIKPIFSRVGDYRALVISVPRKVLMAASADLPSIVEAAAGVLAKGGDPTELSGWFSRDYEERDFEWNAPKNENSYAYRLYGKGAKSSAADLLGLAMLQPEYAKYEGVFLLDTAYGTVARSEKMTDLSDHLLNTPALVAPPKKKALPSGVKIYHRGSNKPFDKTVLSWVGARLPLELRKDKCAPYSYDFTVQKSRCEATVPSEIPWRHIISGVTVDLVDEDGNPIVNGSKKVEVKGAESVRIAGKDCRVMPESDLAQARFIVRCDGFCDKEEVVDLTATKKVTITMQKALTRVSYSVNGTPKNSHVKFELDWPEVDINKSPLPGYKVNSVRGKLVTLERENAAVRKTGNVSNLTNVRLHDRKPQQPQKTKVSKKLLYGLAFGLVAGLLLGWMAGGWMGKRTLLAEMEKQKAEKERIEKLKADSLFTVQLVAYLDKTDKWVKTETDSLFNGALKGVYDALNEYDFNALDAKTDSLKLMGSTRWQTLKEAVDRAKKPDVLNTLKTTRSPYSKDGSITLDKYIGVLDQTAGHIPDKNATQKDNSTNPQTTK